MVFRARITTTRAALAATWLGAIVACESDRSRVSRGSAGAPESIGGEAGRHASAGSPAGGHAGRAGENGGAPSDVAGWGGDGGIDAGESGAPGVLGGAAPDGGQGGDAYVPPTGVGLLAAPLASFASSIAVNTHVIYYDGGYADLDAVLENLAYLGVVHVRDALISANFYDQELYGPWFQKVARAGIRFNLIANGGSATNPFDPAAAIAGARFVEGLSAGAVESIEGFNEINNWPVTYDGETSYAAAARAMKALYDGVKADEVLGTRPVYDLTGGEFAELELGLSDIRGHADVANQHPYPQRGDQPASWIARGFEHYEGDPPKVITEFGYYTDPTDTDGWGGVSEAVQAKSILNGLFDAFALGVTRTYIYELVDVLPDPELWTHHFGLFRSDHSPKPAATAIHNLTTLLSGAEGDFTPGRLDLELSGLPASGNRLLFQRPDGTFVLAVWNEPDNWDEVARQPLATTPVAVSVDLGFAYRSVQVFDPIAGTEPIAIHDGERSFVILIDDHPLLVFVR
jgi:hypothetical protein